MDTDEQILWLCEHGFTLPEGLEYIGKDLALKSTYFTEVGTSESISCILLRKQMAHDLCAAHFARELFSDNGLMSAALWNSYALLPYRGAIEVGNSAKVIDELYNLGCEGYFHD